MESWMRWPWPLPAPLPSPLILSPVGSSGVEGRSVSSATANTSQRCEKRAASWGVSGGNAGGRQVKESAGILAVFGYSHNDGRRAEKRPKKGGKTGVRSAGLHPNRFWTD